MRLDKYLKVSRLVKRRTLAQEICQGGHVKRNGRAAKPSAEVGAGDILDLRLGSRIIRVKVLKTPPNADKDKASSMYELISDERDEDESISFA